MAEAAREAWITGVGIVSCLGEGSQAHWQKLMEAHPSADTATFAPFIVHPLAPINFDGQIPKKEQRQMENWQRIGTYAAGLALDSAGVKGKPEILSHMDMIVAAGGGERDLAVDTTILSGMPRAANPAAFLNERLMSDLRPTLFLSQLSNLLAGNISIVHGVTGSSRTFMGEESSGVDAVRIALSRIVAGQSDIALVGGSQNAERPDLLIIYQFGGINLKDHYAPVWERGGNGAWIDGRLPGDRGARARREARRQTAGAIVGRGIRPRQPAARHRRGKPQGALGQDQRQGQKRPRRGAVRRHRCEPRDRRGAGISQPAWRPCRARHRFLSRSWTGAAIPDECSAGSGRGRAW